MVGILGAIVFGAVCAGAWVYDSNKESKRRANSKADGCPFYIDKNGRLRHTRTGKKYTVAEVNQLYSPETIAEKQAKYIAQCKDVLDDVFWEVRVLSWGDSSHHYFLSEKEAYDFLRDYKKKNKIYSEYIGKRSKTFLESMKNNKHVNTQFHFDYDKYVGKVIKPWEKNK